MTNHDEVITATCERCSFTSPLATAYDLSTDGWAIADYSFSNFPEHTFCDACASFLGAF